MRMDCELVESILSECLDWCETVKGAGGIALCDVVNGDAPVPDGWILDELSNYFVPANLHCVIGTKH